jgi:hypothetical protein
LVDDCFSDWLTASPGKIIFCYEDYKKDPRKIISHISVIITGQVLPSNALEEILDSVNNLHRYDPKKTFFSENKITAGGKVNNFSKDLTSEEIAFIEENYPEWIVNYEDH